jgi:signal transduction histidine kinase
MYLLRKTLLVVTGTVILSMIAIYFASRATLLQGYEKIEKDDTQANVLRTVNSYYDQSKGIVISARAYAVWDDMYNFVQQPEPEFLDYLGLTPGLFVTHQVNLIAILAVNYKPAYLKMYDLETLQPLEIPPDLSGYLHPGSPLLKHTTENPEISGVILLDGEPMYIASLASLHTDFTGEPRGAVIFGRYLDNEVVSKLSETSHLKVSTYLPNMEDLPAELRDAIVGLGIEPVYVHSLNEDAVNGYTYIKTIDGQPAFILKVELPRRIYSEGITSFYYFTAFTAVAGLVFIIVSTLLLRHFVLHPLTKISKQISEIQASGDHSKRLTVQGKDELARLGHTINGLLAVLENRTHEIELANKELESYSYSVSHDLRAPLRAMDGFTKMVVEDYGAQLEQDGLSYLLKTRESIKRMNRLIDDFLAFSRLSRQHLNKQTIQTEQVVRQVLNELHPEYAGRQVEFLIADLPTCEADASMLYQVFMNLIGNAVKYTNRREKAIIEVGWMNENDQTVYFVKDNGAGFNMQYVDKLFGVFQRLHCQDEFDGTGVGLAVTQRIIQRHGGKIWAEAEVDKGATFYFTL